MEVMLAVGGVVLWLVLLTFALALGRVAGRADRLQADTMRQAEALDRLGRVRSPSGKPFFPTPRHRQRLLRSLAELRREAGTRLRPVALR